MAYEDDEDQQIRSVALQNAQTILLARQRAEEALRQTQEELRQSEQRLRAIFDQAAVGISISSLDGHFLQVNEKTVEILGYTHDELRGMTFLDLTHPDDVASSRTAMRQLLEREASAVSFEKRYIRKGGAALWSWTTVTILKDREGQPQQFIGVIEDVSARKRAESALVDETRMLELLNRTGEALGSTLDLPTLLQAATDAATELSGAQFGAFFYNQTDAKGQAYQLFTLSGAPREAFERFGQLRPTALFAPTFRGEGPIRCDDVLQDPRYGRNEPHGGMPQGHLPVRSYLAVAVKSRSGEVLGALIFGHPQPSVFTDRSEHLVLGVAAQAGMALDNARLYEVAKQAAEDRRTLLESEREARNAAEHMSEMKGEFLATLSHELRTPLNAIVGWAQLLRTRPATQEQLAKGLETIERNARVQAQLIEDLLDMSRITSGKLRLDIQRLHPAGIVESAVETLATAAEAKGIRVETIVDPSAGPIMGDPGRLQQVMWNLLSNAIKFTPRGGKVQVVLERVNSHIELSVADSGCGVKPEFMPHLFERFRQGTHSTTRSHGGLGLGLSIVKSLVELHGGGVSARSPGEGQGTTVVVSLPLSIVVPSEDRERTHPRALPPEPADFVTMELAGLTVLVVDDQPDARELIKRVLEDCSATVLTAASADEALAVVKASRPQVLITDIGMPGTDGYELLRQVRELESARGGRVPAIALTAFARSEDRTRALRAGFQVHVAKPVDPSELVATVAAVAGRVDPV
jgi:PAS domain S-box-containing protein